MEKDVALGSVGKLALVLNAGMVTISANASEAGGALVQTASIGCSLVELVDLLEAEVAKAIPASAPLDPMIFGALKQLVVAIK